MARLIATLSDAMADTSGDPVIAARSPQLLDAWADADPRVRDGVLLSLAWHSRSRSADRGDTASHRYARELQRLARDCTDDVDSFYGPDFPAGSRPGPVRRTVASCTNGRDNLELSLETGLILFSRLAR